VNPWPFVVAAYAVTGGAMAALAAASFVAMRRAERAAEHR
jgi:hypothetical protein